MDAIELYFAVVVFIVVYMFSLAFEFVAEIIKWDYLSESCCYCVCLLFFLQQENLNYFLFSFQFETTQIKVERFLST